MAFLRNEYIALIMFSFFSVKKKENRQKKPQCFYLFDSKKHIKIPVVTKSSTWYKIKLCSFITGNACKITSKKKSLEPSKLHRSIKIKSNIDNHKIKKMHFST